MIKEKAPSKCDALAIGSGGAGFVAALRLKDLRPDWEVWLAEKTDKLGGATSYSGGVCWLPGHQFKKDPAEDSERARTYLKKAYPEIHEPSLDGFLTDAPRVLEFMLSKGVQMEDIPDYPDYYQEIEGSTTGRSILPLIYD
ncbi:FAD-binding protein [Thermodesulfobacteriota bacterium]